MTLVSRKITSFTGANGTRVQKHRQTTAGDARVKKLLRELKDFEKNSIVAKNKNKKRPEYILDYEFNEGNLFYRLKAIDDVQELWVEESKVPVEDASRFLTDHTRKLIEYLNKAGITWHSAFQYGGNNCYIGNRDGKKHGKKSLTAVPSGYLERLYEAKPSGFTYKSAYKAKKEKQLKRLKRFSAEINKLCRNKPHVEIENNVDLDCSLFDFKLITESVPHPNVILPTGGPLFGCKCKNNCNPENDKTACCPQIFGQPNVYKAGGLLKHQRVVRVQYECNSACNCPKSCSNRVLQNGSKCSLAVFRTSNGRGWGLKALKLIQAGAFILEYVGEIVTSSIAETRGREYDGAGATYLFDLDVFEKNDTHLTIDAKHQGNISRFMNHSCEPNCQIISVFVEVIDPSMPRLGFYAIKDIKPNEEITFDYSMELSVVDKTKQRQCLCGAKKCKQLIVL